MEKRTAPIRSAAHRKEDISKRAFEELIDPYFVQDWISRDYGVDTVVEVTSALNSSNSAEITGKCFMVQLKSTERLMLKNEQISFSVPVVKIVTWYKYNLPVLFVLYDLTAKLFYVQWIDEILIASLEQNSPNWRNQKTVSLKIPTRQLLQKTQVPALETYVNKWKGSSRKPLEHGRYFSLQEEAISYLEQHKKTSATFKFSSVSEDVKKLERDIYSSIYKIAITGPSRVGKSTIVNKLLKQEVSPTGFFQTTGVPIQVLPGEQNLLRIFFHDGRSSNMAFSLDKVKEYASQELNEDNVKGVQLIAISLKNDDLESGIALFDIPGLDDPSDEIQSYTRQTIQTVNAVIYIIDASPFEDGGYIFKSEYKKDMESFGLSKDKVFLVFNKVDKLSEDVIGRLRERVMADLRKYELLDIVGEKVFYLSAKNELTLPGTDRLDHLRESLWDYILAENKSGIIRLGMRNQELLQSSKAFCGLINARLLDSARRKELEGVLLDIQRKLPGFIAEFEERESSARLLLNKSLDNHQHELLSRLEKKLRSFSTDTQLPDKLIIKKGIIDSLHAALQQGNKEFAAERHKLKNHVDQWMEHNLKLLQTILYPQGESKTIDFAEIDTLEIPDIDFSSAFGMGLLGMLSASLFAPAYVLGAGLIGFIGNLFASAEGLRLKRISQTMDSARNKYAISFAKIKKTYGELFDENRDLLQQYIKDKIQGYFGDIQMQLSKFSEPISEAERQQYAQALEEAAILQEKILVFAANLQSYDARG